MPTATEIKTFEREIVKITTAMVETDRRIEMRECDMQGATWNGNTDADRAYFARLRGQINAMERRQKDRQRKIENLTSRLVTGKNWADFRRNLGQGPQNGYRPSVSRERVGEKAVTLFAAMWMDAYGSNAYIY